MAQICGLTSPVPIKKYSGDSLFLTAERYARSAILRRTQSAAVYASSVKLVRQYIIRIQVQNRCEPPSSILRSSSSLHTRLLSLSKYFITTSPFKVYRAFAGSQLLLFHCSPPALTIKFLNSPLFSFRSSSSLRTVERVSPRISSHERWDRLLVYSED